MKNILRPNFSYLPNIKKNVIQIGQEVSEKGDDKHHDKRFLYIRYYIIGKVSGMVDYVERVSQTFPVINPTVFLLYSHIGTYFIILYYIIGINITILYINKCQ